MSEGPGDERRVLLDERRAERLRVAHQRAELEPLALERDLVEAAMPLMSMSRLGASRRRLSAAIRLWPPASSRAPFLCLPRRAIASRTDETFAYANAAGFTELPLATHGPR